ncbi:MAG: 1-acyl-sn-glycerol-3-phosphate acyltransferase [Gammaproteobacteria bacterium]|nr:MAG: 1-acyl-sn-glycerol-3-phosphate acyltransferase [Gammaproteobacteria bacterium]
MHFKKKLRFLPKILFFAILVKPLVLFLLGLNVRGKKNLPGDGAIIAANHNSHLDTLVLMSLYPLSQIHKVRPVAAADYFFRNRYLSWFSSHVIGVIALKREGFTRPDELFAECYDALNHGDVLIIYPEGSRGKPEQFGRVKKGIFYLQNQSENRPDIYPVVLRGLGNALPKGEALLVPFNCDVIIGEKLSECADFESFGAELYQIYERLLEECLTK